MKKVFIAYSKEQLIKEITEYIDSKMSDYEGVEAILELIQ